MLLSAITGSNDHQVLGSRNRGNDHRALREGDERSNPFPDATAQERENPPNVAATVARNGLTSIGAPGFEPGTSCSQSRRATGLRHTPYRDANKLASFQRDAEWAPSGEGRVEDRRGLGAGPLELG
jgi:hypothetical protein